MGHQAVSSREVATEDTVATAFKINSMAIACGGDLVVGGMESGEIGLFDPGDLTLASRCQTNLGDIYGLAAHPHRPLVATLGMDHTIALVDLERPTAPRVVDRFCTRNLAPWNDIAHVDRNPSQSQAIAFHPALDRIATRGASAGVLELDYGNGRIEDVHCTRMHGLEDVTTVCYPTGESPLLVSAALGSVVFSQDGLILDEMRVARGNVHWFEPLAQGGVHLVATDDRRVVKVDLDRREVLHEGPVFTRDDLEHVHVNPTSGRAFVVGFDRNVYEIDPQTCGPIGIVYRAPFKMRWFKTLSEAPDVGFAQCFDGAIYKVDLSTGSLLGLTRRTPPPLWTGCRLGADRLAFAGEGDEVAVCRIAAQPATRRIMLKHEATLAKPEKHSYTKRMVTGPDGSLFLAQTSGKVLAFAPDGAARTLADFGSAVRDIAVDAAGGAVFVCLESGHAHRLAADTGKVDASWVSPDGHPAWALAHNAAQGLLAVAERQGRIRMLDARTLTVVHPGPEARRVKRVRWFDDDTLAFNREDSLQRWHMESDTTIDWVAPFGNTVEDFCWSRKYGYLFLIGYTTDVTLCDLNTGEKLYVGADQEDYSKGILCLEEVAEHAYPIEILTFGRSGRVHGFRPHGDKLVAHGPVSGLLVTRYYHD